MACCKIPPANKTKTQKNYTKKNTRKIAPQHSGIPARLDCESDARAYSERLLLVRRVSCICCGRCASGWSRVQPLEPQCKPIYGFQYLRSGDGGGATGGAWYDPREVAGARAQSQARGGKVPGDGKRVCGADLPGGLQRRAAWPAGVYMQHAVHRTSATACNASLVDLAKQGWQNTIDTDPDEPQAIVPTTTNPGYVHSRELCAHTSGSNNATVDRLLACTPRPCESPISTISTF